MAKRKQNNQAANLIIMLLGLAAAAVAFVGLACKFISAKGTIIGFSNTKHLNLSEWLDTINDFADYDEIANWQIARIMLFVTVALLAVMVVSLLMKCFTKKSFILKWLTFSFAVTVLVCASVFLITTLTGCTALSGNAIVIGAEYSANVGVYLLSIGAIVSAVLTGVAALRK